MTIQQHFEAIEDPVIRQRALANINPSTKDENANSLSDAFGGGFDWARSPEGLKYWNKIHNKSLEKEI